MIKKIHHHIHHHKATYGKYIIIMPICLILLAFLLTGGTMWNINKSENKVVKIPLQKITPILPKEKGALQLTTKNRKSNYAVNETVNTIISASSDGEPVVGYDIVLRYDASKLEFQKSKSLDVNFKMFNSPTEGELNLTGVKQVDLSNSIALTNSPLAEVQFKTKAHGSTSIQIHFIPNSTTESNLMSEKNRDILGKVESISLMVKD